MARVGGIALLCGLAFWLGRSTGWGGLERVESGLAALDQRLQEQARARGAECVGTLAALGQHAEWSPQQLEQAVENALAAERTSRAALSQTAEELPAAPPPPPVDVTAALERGRQVVASATSQRRWTAAEAEAFQGVLPHLDPETRRALMAEFSRAVNTDQFRLDTVGPPF